MNVTTTVSDNILKMSIQFPQYLEEFTCFQKLPVEIRNTVWKEVCFEPRVVDLWVSEMSENQKGLNTYLRESLDGFEREVQFIFRTYSQPPSILHVNQEARHEALKYYQLVFGTEYKVKLGRNMSDLQITTDPEIYFNWKCDILLPMDLYERYWIMFGILDDLRKYAHSLKRFA